MDIYVGNLSYDLDEQSLREAFEAHGQVENVKIVIDFDTGRSKGFGFVTMNNDDEGDAAIRALDGENVSGRNLKVNQARERESRPPRGGGGGGGGGGRGGFGGGGGGRGGRGGGGGGGGGRY